MHFKKIVFTLALLISSCSVPNSVLLPPELIQSPWKLISIQSSGQAVQSISAANHLTFQIKEDHVSGVDSCSNTFSGKIESSSEKGLLRVGRLLTTQLPCASRELSDLSSQYLKALESVTGFQIQADQLTLYYGPNRSELVFGRSK